MMIKLIKATHILHSYLQICHVGFAVLGCFVSLVVEGEPAVHKGLDLSNGFELVAVLVRLELLSSS